jgi:hypothetical protein
MMPERLMVGVLTEVPNCVPKREKIWLSPVSDRGANSFRSRSEQAMLRDPLWERP